MRIACTLLLFAASLCSLKAAVIVTPAVTPQGSDFAYDYTVVNNESLSIIFFQLTLSVSPTSVQAPPGWISNSFASGGDTFVQFASETDDILPSESRAGFIVVSPFSPVPVAFDVLLDDVNLISGVTTGPGQAAIPEPSTFIFATIAIAAAPVLRRLLGSRKHTIKLS